ncbi:hypothetical protein [Deinococcus sp.]|uniref:hypothetical protein n=1 Tax=Deinococcus sp. TaxID=47478 RepID=UPI003C7A31E9
MFNLGTAELQSGSGEGKAAGQRRIEQLTRTHPDDLHAKIHLAGQATEQGDLERARELLALPEGRSRFHVQEYALLLSAQGRLALVENHTELALGAVAEILGRIGGVPAAATRPAEIPGRAPCLRGCLQGRKETDLKRR